MNRVRKREILAPGVPSLKACLFPKKIKGIKALDRHERHSLYNLLSIHSQQHQQRKTQLFSLGKSWKASQTVFPTSKQRSGISQPSPWGNDMFVSMLCVLIHKVE